MAHLSSVQLTRVPSSTSETPLDLNLCQKASQAIFKFHNETEASVAPPKSSETTGRFHLKNGSKITSGVSKLIANGFLSSSAQTGSERTGENVIVRSTPSGVDPYEPPQSSDASVKDVNCLQLAERTNVFAGKQRPSRAETAGRVQKDLSQSEAGTSEGGTGNEFLQTFRGSKRKSLQMQQSPDATKKVILALEAHEDEGLPKRRGRPRGSNHRSRDVILYTPHLQTEDAPADVAERRLFLEERKVKLAEQRFALEQRKLEATIEIGKGLIIAMEKMTNTISGMGATKRQK